MTIFHGDCGTAKVKGALTYLCCFTTAWPSTEPGQHWWNRKKGIRYLYKGTFSLHPCISPCCVPYPCNKEPCVVLFPRQGQGGSCKSGLIVLGAGRTHSSRLPVPRHTVGGRGTTHKMWILVRTAERITLLECPDPAVLTSKASWNDAGASLGCSFPMEHHVSAAVSCEQWGEGRGKAVT